MGRPAAVAAFLLLALVFTPATAAWAKERPPTRIWDPQIEPIAHAVSRIRGLGFTHPVTVNFVAPRRFEVQAADGAAALSSDDRRWFRDEAARLRALGLIPAGVDLAKATTALARSSELAYYDPGQEEIFVKGAKLDVSTRVTVAHELTHALDDQNFGLDHVDSRIHDSVSDLAVASLVEGDAEWVMLRYAASLTGPERRAYTANGRKLNAELSNRLVGAHIPSILDVAGAAPYTYGALMIDAVRARGGQPALDRMFRRPPTDDRSVLAVEHPAAQRHTLAAPPVPTAERRVLQKDRLGSVGLYHVLVSRLDPLTALHAAAGRDDDRMLVTRRADGVACVHLTITARTAGDRARLVDALTAWSAAGTPGAAAVATSADPTPAGGDPVEFTACDEPGASAPPNFTPPAVLVMLRSEVVIAGLRRHAAGPMIECVADHLLADPAVRDALPAQLTDEGSSSIGLRAAVKAGAAAAQQACGVLLTPRSIGRAA